MLSCPLLSWVIFLSRNSYCLPHIWLYVEPMATFTTWAKFSPLIISAMQRYVAELGNVAIQYLTVVVFLCSSVADVWLIKELYTCTMCMHSVHVHVCTTANHVHDILNHLAVRYCIAEKLVIFSRQNFFLYGNWFVHYIPPDQKL